MSKRGNYIRTEKYRKLNSENVKNFYRNNPEVLEQKRTAFKRWTERKTLEYRLWREAVFARDNFTCIWCFQRGGKLQADHIKPFALYPELRFALDNGRTLCEDCHKTTNTYGGKITTLKKQRG